MMVGIGGVIFLLGWTYATCLFLAARYLRDRRRRMFCLVINALHCLSVPIGTILGVCTIVVLSRPSVKAMFEGGKPA